MIFEHSRELKILGISTLIICICEAGALSAGENFSPIRVIAVTRLLQIFLLTWFLWIAPNGLWFAGLSRGQLLQGLKTGLFCSFAFGGIVFLTAIFLFFVHINPLHLIHFDLPEEKMAFFLFTGLFTGPIAEELYFRGILYSFFRRFGVLSATVITTLIFGLFHLSTNSLPIPQIIGGVVFALSFEYSKSLITPVIIHITGNTALLLISLISNM